MRLEAIKQLDILSDGRCGLIGCVALNPNTYRFSRWILIKSIHVEYFLELKLSNNVIPGKLATPWKLAITSAPLESYYAYFI